MRLAIFHLFNDFSGSPTVLHNLLKSLAPRQQNIDLITSHGGILDRLSTLGVNIRHYTYHFSSSPIVTMARYAGAQILTGIMALRYITDRRRIFYINTLLPVGPALAGRLTGHRVIYHYHENADAKGLFYRLLAKAMLRLAHRIICVSDYQASFLSDRSKVVVVPNALDPTFVARLRPNPEAAFDRRRVLMLGSLKVYKGTAEFVALARTLPTLSFTLVLNDTPGAVGSWLSSFDAPSNLTVHSRCDDVSVHYNSASLVLNLSRPDLFVETFGLTALEAMACALPVIVPPVGGIAELVEDGVTGFHVDSRNHDLLAERVSDILTDRSRYLAMARNAHEHSHRYDSDRMTNQIENILHS